MKKVVILHTVAEEAFCKKCRIASADGCTFEVVECFALLRFELSLFVVEKLSSTPTENPFCHGSPAIAVVAANKATISKNFFIVLVCYVVNISSVSSYRIPRHA